MIKYHLYLGNDSFRRVETRRVFAKGNIIVVDTGAKLVNYLIEKIEHHMVESEDTGFVELNAPVVVLATRINDGVPE